MDSARYSIRHEAGADYSVIDNKTGIPKASGLNADEAEECAGHWNQKEQEERDEASARHLA